MDAAGKDEERGSVEVGIVVACRNALGEGPIWDDREQVLYWVDIERRELWRFRPDSGEEPTRSVLEHKPSALGLHGDGGLVVATSGGLGYWDHERGELSIFHRGPEELGKGRFNDGAVDPAGRLWVGTMVERGHNRLYRLDGGELTLVEGGLQLPNGMGWSPDRRRLYFTDTGRKTIFVYDYEIESGEIGNRRALFELTEPVSPDGLAVDEEGFLWSALYHGGRVIRISPDGVLDRTIELPARNPTSVAFGGPRLDRLYITSAAQGVEERREDGNLMVIEPGVAGRPENRFRQFDHS